ncbi:hypothetical protein HGB07_06990 [Candidatus Roizmanbacteria bacterium]|nr:hypothetical protein [Candidatus Roizmanbacteria bacterium]
MKSKISLFLMMLFFISASPSHAVKPFREHTGFIESIEVRSIQAQTKFEVGTIMNYARFLLIGKTR